MAFRRIILSKSLAILNPITVFSEPGKRQFVGFEFNEPKLDLWKEMLVHYEHRLQEWKIDLRRNLKKYEETTTNNQEDFPILTELNVLIRAAERLLGFEGMRICPVQLPTSLEVFALKPWPLDKVFKLMKEDFSDGDINELFKKSKLLLTTKFGKEQGKPLQYHAECIAETEGLSQADIKKIVKTLKWMQRLIERQICDRNQKALRHRKESTVGVSNYLKDQGTAHTAAHLQKTVLYLDDLNIVRSIAKPFSEQESRPDILWNNAGIGAVPVGLKIKQRIEAHMGGQCYRAASLHSTSSSHTASGGGCLSQDFRSHCLVLLLDDGREFS
ncbi:hypothetical protein TSTA_067680 [Talaromyces stipitatus ATCC 10500]|uniref:Uncharacterized protein n=1 Tax=Talaromyces stipitatus (strain ATCC 10500 / CBS 375.48 / QM 6759 / NRRL 1006) TaxID=441959 RepID=B8LY91_TALSN|nr:uncharacterized protein TSTA_067680 [Talaromyces stipitatus ATCC 10500]EED23336.1 hypothetical protein TSTA_067680 [Talaromyces stipitatus ATCC 10500]